MNDLTKFLALWGAVVSTIVAAWNIYKDFLKRDRVKVSAGFRIMTPPQQEVFAFNVTNLTAQRIRVTHIGGYPYRLKNRRLIRRILSRFTTLNTKAWLFSFQPLSGPSLPAIVEPRDMQTFIYSIDREKFPIIEDLAISTADGKEWFCRRRDIHAIHEDATYKEIRERESKGVKQQ